MATGGATAPYVDVSLIDLHPRPWHTEVTKKTKLNDTDGDKMSCQDMDLIHINRQSDHRETVSSVDTSVKI